MAIPEDDLTRKLVVAHRDDAAAEHIGVVGDTYTVLLDGAQTSGRFCLIDMHVPPGGGPGPHRHNFEETFLLLDGAVELMFRGEKQAAGAGSTVHIPANAPHSFHNVSDKPARLLCICSPAGQEEFFREIGVKVGSSTEAPPKPTPEEQKAFQEKAAKLAPHFQTELLPPE